MLGLFINNYSSLLCDTPSQTENNQSLINKSVSLGISIMFEQLSTSTFLHMI